MAKKIIKIGVIALLLSLQLQVNAANERRNSVSCTQMTNTFSSAVSCTAGNIRIRTGLQTNLKRLHASPITGDTTITAIYPTHVETASLGFAMSKIGMPVGLNGCGIPGGSGCGLK